MIQTIISGNGNVDFGTGGRDVIDLSGVLSRTVNFNLIGINGGTGVVYDPGNGARLFDAITLNDGRQILFEGIDTIRFADQTFSLPVVIPNDPLFSQQWNLHMLNLPHAWRFTQGASSVLIGIQDTGLGVNATNQIHPDLRLPINIPNDNYADDFFRNVWDFSYGPQPESHGTGVTGIIAASSNNGQGMSGINWNSPVAVIDVLDNNARDQSLVQATQALIAQASSQGQQLVVNMSLGTELTFGGNFHAELGQVIASNPNVLFVIAAGNDGDRGLSGLSSPAVLANQYSNVIAVGAVLGTGQRLPYSQYGAGLTLVAPSEVIATLATRSLFTGSVEFGFYSTNPFAPSNRFLDDFNGTSAAAPHVSGVASLVWSANPNLTATQVSQILSATALDLGSTGYDQFYGYGLINADAAVRRAISFSQNTTGTSTMTTFFYNGTSGDDSFSYNGTLRLRARAGAGNDFIWGNNGDDLIDAGDGNDLVRGWFGDDHLYGGNGDDTLRGEWDDDYVSGGNGNDRLVWNDDNGDDHFDGGLGNDVAEINGSALGDDAFVLESLGFDSTNAVLFERTNLTPASLVVETVEGFEVNGGGGNDSLIVGNLTGSTVNLVTFSGGTGSDRLDGRTTSTTLIASGGSDNDELWGGSANDVLSGDDGNDVLSGGAGNDSLSGGTGNDLLSGGSGNDVISGGDGDDGIVWNDGDGSDVIDGGLGTDILEVNGSNLVGDAFVLSLDTTTLTSSDLLLRRTNLPPVALNVDFVQTIEIFGNGGNDSLVVNNLTGSTLNQVAFSGGAGDDLLNGINTNVQLTGFGGSGNDTLVGGSGNDSLSGDDGNDVLSGGAGNDSLSGGTGNDLLSGGSGNDVISGGDGDDGIVWNDGDGSDVIDGGLGTDILEVNGSNLVGDAFVLSLDTTTLTSSDLLLRRTNLPPVALNVDFVQTIEIFGNGGNDSLVVNNLTGSLLDRVIFSGDTGNDQLNGSNTNVQVIGFGGSGNDTLQGGSASDELFGDDGNDSLMGWSGNDILSGGAGNDRLDGYAFTGTEFDTLTGGSGSDTFVLGWYNTAGVGNVSYLGTGYATITDWEGQFDFLEVLGSISQYSIQTGNFGVGGLATDSALLYGNDLIAVIQDSTNINFSNFRFI
jgi:Ca2+-binding RTX toxin-like protein